jgi:hypothetical protein
LVLSFQEKPQNGKVSKNCVVRYTSDSFESYFFNGRQILLFDPVATGKDGELMMAGIIIRES